MWPGSLSFSGMQVSANCALLLVGLCVWHITTTRAAEAQSYCVGERNPQTDIGKGRNLRVLALVNHCPRAVRAFYAFHNLETRPSADQVLLEPDQSWSIAPRRNIGAVQGSDSEYGSVELMGLCFEDDDRCRSNMLREQQLLNL